MNTYKIQTNYINPVVLAVFGMLPIMSQAIPQFSIFRDLRSNGYSERSVFYLILIAITAWLCLVVLFEYYRGIKYIEVKINDEGISANWFYGSSYSSLFGRRVEKNIKWEEIVKFDTIRTYGSGWTQGMWIETKNDSRRYWIAFLIFYKSPKLYKAMKADFETRYEACKNNQPQQFSRNFENEAKSV